MRLLRQNKTNHLPKLIFVLVFILTCWARAEEGGEKSAESSKEGEGAIAKPIDYEAVEWKDDEGRIGRLKANIEKSGGELKELFETRSKVKDAAEASSMSREIADKTKAMNEDIAEYRKLQLHIRFLHPEKGDFSPRKYEREQATEITPEEHQFDSSIQGKLDRVKANFKAHYTVESRKPIASSANEKREPASEEALNESKRIILAK